jgi:hypothetical protein
MSISVRILIRHPVSTGLEVVSLVLDVHVVHEPTVHYLEPLVHILDSNLHQHIKQLPNEEINDAVAQPFSMFELSQVLFIQSQPVSFLVCAVPYVASMVLWFPRRQFAVEPKPHLDDLVRFRIHKFTQQVSIGVITC